MKKLPLLFFFAFISLASCNKKPAESESTENRTMSQDTLKQGVEKPAVPEIEQVWATEAVFNTPESVLYDEAKDVFYVANIGGKNPLAKDGNGFISKLKADGKVETLEWVKGLNAPKGMAVFNGFLYVTDIDNLVKIDIEKGKIVKKYPIKDAKFLNDVTVDAKGTVFFTDMEAGKVHTLTGEKTEDFLDKLQNCNGLFAEENRLLMHANGKFNSVDYATKAVTPLADSIQGDGIGKDEKQNYYLSEWVGAIYYFADGKKVQILNSQDQKINSADITYSVKYKLLLVPTFFDNKVVAYKMK